MSLGETIQPQQWPHPCAVTARIFFCDVSHRPFSFPLTLGFQFHLKLQVHPLPPPEPRSYPQEGPAMGTVYSFAAPLLPGVMQSLFPDTGSPLLR